MKALLLAGGYATRLGSIVENMPKPMIKVGSKPVVGHIVDGLRAAGINKILTKIHYLPFKIPEYLGDKTLYYYETVLKSHVESIKSLKDWLQGDSFFVINADTLSNIDYKDMIKKHKNGTITALMDEWRCAGTWLYDKEYFTNPSIPVIPYRPKGLFWLDIGVPSRLKEAKINYQKYESKYKPK